MAIYNDGAAAAFVMPTKAATEQINDGRGSFVEHFQRREHNKTNAR